eukprot:TRINITY_DN24698_c0_g1_i1.p1 TRINITY_DN24698_c0_g1~~TRINITY_DN24698_c0_g1_i1.p1  ORF type:complete len:163 (+),score=44.00 TRINITY_DN24698_c0_g1_i1:89-577(+)
MSFVVRQLAWLAVSGLVHAVVGMQGPNLLPALRQPTALLSMEAAGVAGGSNSSENAWPLPGGAAEGSASLLGGLVAATVDRDSALAQELQKTFETHIMQSLMRPVSPSQAQAAQQSVAEAAVPLATAAGPGNDAARAAEEAQQAASQWARRVDFELQSPGKH